MMEFPRTLAAVEAAERDLWGIADALLEEVGPPSRDGAHAGSTGKFERAAAELTALGYDYAGETLRQYRDTAAAFPRGTRVPAVTFTAHRRAARAGHPEVIGELVEQGGRVTVNRVTLALGQPINLPTRTPTEMQVREALVRDPEMAERVMHNSPEVRESARRVLASRAEETERRLQVAQEQRQEQRSQAVDLRWVEVSAALQKARNVLEDILPVAERVEWDEEHRQLLTHSADEVQRALDAVVKVAGTTHGYGRQQFEAVR